MAKNKGNKKDKNNAKNNAKGNDKESNQVKRGPIEMLKDNTLRIQLQVKPNAQISQVIEYTNDYVGVQLSAPPKDGEANTECVKFMAEALGVKKSEVSLIGGMKSREKVIRVETSDIDTIEKRLKSLVN
ncbi:DUF167-domain-containing protein [Neocallimastix lanati (nom. inval.)]|uniref:DUF167-domain-containing protein n=1 Tax=Neocallimastix californiae TaxID=1754190 RepID=A0A1Y2AIC2_9FUNG|nr:DUF167-domain-containing protein [Neocallimastix sp. JGI-2020a]ORY21937.1 DUF167-domain-containing protein [Neocallimastix californiae]|eukprot:ORY21937.1 DUF167-domain-containing protein [Neocallimastix californiae]